MPRKAPARGIEAARFALSDTLRRELSEKFPRVDLDRTFEVFRDKALAHGWLYSSWPAAFRNYIRNGKQYGGVEYKAGFADPKFDALLDKARAIGFRMPLPIESTGTYREALEAFDKKQVRQASLNLGNTIKRVPK
jgi:hypothetical protein